MASKQIQIWIKRSSNSGTQVDHQTRSCNPQNPGHKLKFQQSWCNHLSQSLRLGSRPKLVKLTRHPGPAINKFLPVNCNHPKVSIRKLIKKKKKDFYFISILKQRKAAIYIGRRRRREAKQLSLFKTRHSRELIHSFRLELARRRAAQVHLLQVRLTSAMQISGNCFFKWIGKAWGQRKDLTLIFKFCHMFLTMYRSRFENNF